MTKKVYSIRSDVQWYVLGGSVRESAEQYEKNPPDAEKKAHLEEQLGASFAVLTRGINDRLEWYRPSVFKSLPGKVTEYYMVCPIGEKDGQSGVHFKPSDSIELSPEKKSHINYMIAQQAVMRFAPEIYQDLTPLKPEDNVVIYKLNGNGGASIAVRHWMEINKMPEKEKPLIQNDITKTGALLGQQYPVERIDPHIGLSRHWPAVYPSPLKEEQGVFYMVCPIGKKMGGTTHYTPEGAMIVPKDNEASLRTAFFEHSEQLKPIVFKNPEPVESREQEKAATLVMV